MRWFKALMILIATLILSSCATVPMFDCNYPKGYEYTCYSKQDCNDYFKAYDYVLLERFRAQEQDGWYQGIKKHVVPINLWADYVSTLFVGFVSGEKTSDGRIHWKRCLEAYDIDCNLIDNSQGCNEGYTTGD